MCTAAAGGSAVTQWPDGGPRGSGTAAGLVKRGDVVQQVVARVEEEARDNLAHSTRPLEKAGQAGICIAGLATKKATLARARRHAPRLRLPRGTHRVELVVCGTARLVQRHKVADGHAHAAPAPPIHPPAVSPGVLRECWHSSSS